MQIIEKGLHETAKDYTLRLLKENIKNLELFPGSQISENELSSVLGISRTPIREALSELAKVKLVEIVPQKRTSVSLIDEDLIEEARFMRSTMEIAVMDLVCTRRTEEDLIRFEENIILQKLYRDNRSREKLMEKDDEFHRFFFEISHNMEIYSLMQNLQIHFDRVRNMAISAIQDLKIVEDHEAILRGIRERDAVFAKERLAAHLTRVRFDVSAIKEKYPQYFSTE